MAASLLFFFKAVKARWRDAWDSDDEGDMISRTNGFRAFMRFLRRRMGEDDLTEVSRDWATALLKDIKIHDDDFSKVNFPAGTSGESALYKSLLEGRLVV